MLGLPRDADRAPGCLPVDGTFLSVAASMGPPREHGGEGFARRAALSRASETDCERLELDGAARDVWGQQRRACASWIAQIFTDRAACERTRGPLNHRGARFYRKAMR